MFKKVLVTFVATVFFSTSYSATTILQQNVNGYSGCTDKSIIQTLREKPDNSDATIFTIEG